MNTSISHGLGKVEPKTMRFQEPLHLTSGKELPQYDIAYETYGSLNADKTNVILILHALSGDAHAAGLNAEGEQGWWNSMIGPNYPIDTNKFFVICSNIIGGCKGSTGPSSINPNTNRPYRSDFPLITIEDMVNAQYNLIQKLGITQLYAVMGGSTGGMQVLQWLISHPKMIRRAMPIATSARSSPQTIALNEVGRVAIISDPLWKNGEYEPTNPPKKGLSLARMIGHISYLSDTSMREKFGRRIQDEKKPKYQLDPVFAVESYLHYKGEKFVDRFDANSYLVITRAIDYFDLTMDGKFSLEDRFTDVTAKVWVVGISSDWLYPPSESQDIV